MPSMRSMALHGTGSWPSRATPVPSARSSTRPVALNRRMRASTSIAVIVATRPSSANIAPNAVPIQASARPGYCWWLATTVQMPKAVRATNSSRAPRACRCLPSATPTPAIAPGSSTAPNVPYQWKSEAPPAISIMEARSAAAQVRPRHPPITSSVTGRENALPVSSGASMVPAFRAVAASAAAPMAGLSVRRIRTAVKRQ